MKKLFVLLFAMTAFAVSSVAQETATYDDATTQVPDDLPLDEFFQTYRPGVGAGAAAQGCWIQICG